MPTVLLVHCDGTNGSTTFTDTWGGHTLTAVVTAAVSTAQVKFGSGSAVFTGNGAAEVQITGTLSDFDFQSSPFTIECWAYAISAPGVSSLVSQFNNTPGGGWFFGSVSGVLQLWCYDGSATQRQISSGTTIATGAWHHYAVDRDAGGTIRLYIDGVVLATSSLATTFQSAALQTNIGNSNRNADAWPGYIDEVRITKGTALYAGAFTPPTAAFADPPTTARATQVAVEHWLSTNPDLQTTQVLVEHWATVTGTGLQALVTQVAVEQWASVASLSDVIPQNRIMVLA